MSLITAVGLGKAYGPNDIFINLAFSIPQRARIGVVGPNGVGKTTLLRILVGLEDPSAGTVQRSRGLQIGYLPQEAHFESNATLWEECLTAFKPLLATQVELAHLETQMSDPTQAEVALQAYGELQSEFEQQGGYTYESRIHQALTGLGFSHADERRPLQHLSGGQRTRALLARLLLTNPDVLLLDEPTNHLDIAAIEWLEAYLKDWEGAMLIVSHDRYFLDQVASSIWEMTPALETYRGNYSAYLSQRTERYTRRLEEYQTQQEFIEKEEDYIRRNIAGQNTRQAQGRRKRLERMLEEARLIPPHESRRLRLKLQPISRSGDQVLVTHTLAVGYADEGRALFRAPDLVLTRGECAAILGPNGAGKTTFLKTLLNQIPALEGEATLGASLKLGYFAQAHEDLHPRWSLMDEIRAVAPKMLPGEVRDYLARFLFSGDDVFKTVDVLSGGERGRLALACLALQGANLLLLDEPTNHLDLPAQEVLQAILANYGGTILLVSHDRYLIDALATQIWEVAPREGRLIVYDGTYSEYKAFRTAQQAALVPAAPFAKPPIGDSAPAAAKSTLSKMEQKKRQQRLDGLEERITLLEERLATIATQLEQPGAAPDQIQRLALDYQQVQTELDSALETWTELD